MIYEITSHMIIIITKMEYEISKSSTIKSVQVELNLFPENLSSSSARSGRSCCIWR